MLRTEGWHVNAKRVQRIWRREGLKVPQKQPKRGRLWLNDGSCIRLRPCWPNHVWSYDFVMDRTHRWEEVPSCFTVIDEFTRRCMAVVRRAKIELGQLYSIGLDRALRPTWPAEIISVPTTAQSLPLMPSATGSAGSASRPSISSPGHLGMNGYQRELQLKAPRDEILNTEIFYSVQGTGFVNRSVTLWASKRSENG